METNERSKSVKDLNRRNFMLSCAVGFLSLIVLLLSINTVTSDKIVVLQTPGLPHSSIIERTSLDKKSQQATLLAITNNLAQLTPYTYPFQKAFIEVFFSAEDYTRLSQEMQEAVKKMEVDQEKGSRYFVFRDYIYDPVINRHFVMGDVHYVNAAKDTAEPHVYEYGLKIDNYKPVVTFLERYTGTKPHNAAWVAQQKQKSN